MAVPVILGIPWLATALWTMFGSLVTFFGSYFVKRVAIVAAAIATILGLTVAFFAAINLLASGISTVAPPMYDQAMSLIVPDNLDNCVAAFLTAVTLRWAYDWKVKVIQLRLF